MRIKKLAGALAVVGLAAVSGAAFATNGYFSHGYGIKAKGMGGAGIAFGQDSLAAATNPANMVLVGDRWDVGVDWFRPTRESVTASTVTHDGDGKKDFFIPEFGYNKMLNKNMSLGVSVFGNGGMNTKYNDYNATAGGFAFGPSGTPVGVDLSQLFISPTFSFKINDAHSIGIAVNLAYQRFKATGISGFAGQSSDSANLSDRGYDDSWGYGARIGWTGKLNDDLTLGATYQSRTHMGKFDKYRGLFAEQGDFDIPANFGIGAAAKITPKLTAVVDLMRIQYGSIKAIANGAAEGGALGANNGAGFGWQNQTVYKLGLSYEVDKSLTVRAGWNHGDAPYNGSETQFNILAPAVVEDHITLGGTWTLANKGEVSVAYMHAFAGEVAGTNTIKNRMYQNSLGVSYGMKY